MSKKQKKKPGGDAAVSVATEPTTVPAQLFRLSEQQERAAEHIESDAWPEILSLGRLLLVAIHEEDREAAKVWLLRARILGLYAAPESGQPEYPCI